MTQKENTESKISAEFDLIAEDYHKMHKSNIKITGENPEYFAEYKVKDFFEYFENHKKPKIILDFGSGIGNSIAYFRKYFKESELYCADVSQKSIDISKSRFPGNEKYIKIDSLIPLPDNSVDAIFTACVFHHIPPIEHLKWIEELKRVLRPNGILAIYEHNPKNPLTVRAVKNCPIDINAILIKSSDMVKLLDRLELKKTNTEYKVFFPGSLKFLRPLEKKLTKVPFGAQWRVIAENASE